MSFCVWCRERDSNPRTRRGLIYSQLCLTASLSLHAADYTIAIRILVYGADRGIRTHDPLFTKQPL